MPAGACTSSGAGLLRLPNSICRGVEKQTRLWNWAVPATRERPVRAGGLSNGHPGRAGGLRAHLHAPGRACQSSVQHQQAAQPKLSQRQRRVAKLLQLCPQRSGIALLHAVLGGLVRGALVRGGLPVCLAGSWRGMEAASLLLHLLPRKCTQRPRSNMRNKCSEES